MAPCREERDLPAISSVWVATFPSAPDGGRGERRGEKKKTVILNMEKEESE